jgi:hypothetical protein
MIGSASVAAWIAHLAFWILLIWGCVFGELRAKGLAIFVLLWFGGSYGLPLLHPYGATLFSSYVAVLDVILVLMIFKGDIPVT